ncbi:general secretion pathway protein J [Vibrio aerogenes CECT 7868]|uniref:General secretion pathway protein J n=1 Tax=Vibrio aerogenes CECT 7868 TaxID=1216006 RepID=A0A1M5ZCP6_9VIBR|nr:prepilin-type N-terminal cleavage/methylation domain-containing protein [Vibrio aerogenes]SHI21939.1 general secretion pathway protein J [Vibrio aerogenes CECT 7868]
MGSRRQNQSGFTLVEMLVSLAVFSAVLSIVMTGLHQGQMQWERGSKQLDQADYLIKRQNWLRQMFAQANTATFRIEYGAEAPYFLGNEQSLTFISDAPIISGPGTYATVRLKLRQQDDDLYEMVLTQKPYSDPYLDPQANPDDGKSLVLFHDIQHLSWRYFLAPRMEATPLEIKYNRFKPRMEGYWDSEFDANFEQELPQYVALSFKMHQQQYDWYFELPVKPLALIQESQVVVH